MNKIIAKKINKKKCNLWMVNIVTSYLHMFCSFWRNSSTSTWDWARIHPSSSNLDSRCTYPRIYILREEKQIKQRGKVSMMFTASGKQQKIETRTVCFHPFSLFTQSRGEKNRLKSWWSTHQMDLDFHFRAKLQQQRTAAVNVAVIEQLNQGQILKLSFLLSFKWN